MNNPAEIPDSLRLPFETGEAKSEDAVVGSLFDALGSDPEFASEDEEPEGSDGPEPEESEEDDAGAEGEDEDAEEAPADEPEDESEEDEDEDDSEEEPDTQPRYRVKVHGEEVEVTLDELKAGFSRTQDYTRKTTEAAEIKRAAAEARDRYAAQLEQLEGLVAGMAPPEPDWDKLRKEDPNGFAVQFADHQRRKADLDALQAERARVWQEQQVEAVGQYQEALAGEFEKLVEKIPEWKDPEVSKAERAKLAEYAQKTYGWTQQDLGNVGDHRLMVLLYKAQQLDELMGKKGTVKEKAKGAKKVLRAGGRRPGAPKAKGKKSAVRQAQDRLARTGRPDDAARAIELLMGPDD